ncbi:hypothetical protein [Chitinophaga polysaccharea]|uniref:hypothetical protein n=1 Tax=Chitinophaga polysaccharea TaxID=1293035 RepID=UPI001156D27C|nr:hypothetical protein [Chitinophaga polysaccharea]
MEVFTIDHPFPDERFRNYEGPILRFNKTGFDVIMFLNRVTDKGKASFVKQPIKYGLCITMNVPFFVGLFGGTEYLDSSFNIKGLPVDEAEEWLRLKSIFFNFYVVDSEDYHLKVIKRIEFDPSFERELMSTLKQQKLHYLNASEVDIEISDVQKV